MLKRLEAKDKDKTPDSIKAFSQHGFKYIPENITGKQVFGVCPFCGHKEHKHAFTFYINSETKRWDCKSCHREGGFITFLEEMVAFGKEHFQRDIAMHLMNNRGISIKTFREFEIGYNPNNNTYLIPVRDAKKDRIWNLYYWKQIQEKNNIKSLMRGTESCLPALYGWEDFHKTGDVWLCEGHWDKLVMWEILQALDMKEDIVIGTSSGIFKQEWTGFFQDRKVNVLYDNDEAGTGHYDANGVGKGGCLLVQQRLSSIVKDLRFLNWPGPYSYDKIGKFDVRDLYLKMERQCRRTYKTIINFMKPTPPPVPIPEGVVIKEAVAKAKLDGPGMTHEEVYAAYEKHILVKDRTVIDLIYGSIIANRYVGDPIWLFLVAPPGGSKSEFLMSVDGAPLIFTLTSLTPKTLVSGSNSGPGGADPSLLPNLHLKVLVIKDFTTILKQPINDREATFGTLRDIYDEKTDFAYGTGGIKRYKVHFGILSGVTPAIEIETESDSTLGERFLRFNMPFYSEDEEQKEIIRIAMNSVAEENVTRPALSAIGTAVLNYNYEGKPFLPVDIAEKMVSLAQWTALLRGFVNRQKYTELVTHRPITEVPTRISKQFKKLAMGIALFRREEEIGEYIYDIIKRVAKSTAPSRNEMVVRYFYERKDIVQSAGEVSRGVGLPSGTVSVVLDNLVMLKILEKVDIQGLRGSSYRLTSRIIKLIKESEVYG